jgi:hypothetical protein
MQQTNGKAERFNQPSIHEWAYASPFANSAGRSQATYSWLSAHKTTRSHSALRENHPSATSPEMTSLTRTANLK